MNMQVRIELQGLNHKYNQWCNPNFNPIWHIGFFWTVSNFVVIAPMIMKFDTGIKLDVFYTMVTKNVWRHYYYVIKTSPVF